MSVRPSVPEAPPAAVLAAWGLLPDSAEPLHDGLMNATWRVRTARGGRRVLQRLHPVFDGRVNLDIAAVTEHLRGKGVLSPRLLPTRDGRGWVEHEGRCWRLLSYVPGRTFHRVHAPVMAAAAGRMLGRFHLALADYERPLAFRRPSFHDTARYLDGLRSALQRHTAHPEFERVAPLAEAILAEAERLPPLPSLPERMIHGDPKISNLRFRASRMEAVSMLDLDTLGRARLAVELGDALRSWCNRCGEDGGRARADADLLSAALRGWAEDGGRDVSSRAERESFVLGLRTISLELASRFCTDALEERYFAWDPERFPSRSRHAQVRARVQLDLSRSVAEEQGALERLAAEALGDR